MRFIAQGNASLKRVPCGGRPGDEGTVRCNYRRLYFRLFARVWESLEFRETASAAVQEAEVEHQPDHLEAASLELRFGSQN